MGSNPTGGTRTVVRTFEDAIVHPPEVRAQARRLYLAGATVAEVARAVKLSYPTVRQWCKDQPESKQRSTAQRCFRCRPAVEHLTDLAQYAYLLGLYLGDGHLVTSARVPVLRVYCANAWPALLSPAKRR